MAEPDDANNKLDKDLLKAIRAITSFDPTGSPSANRKSLEDKLPAEAPSVLLTSY